MKRNKRLLSHRNYERHEIPSYQLLLPASRNTMSLETVQDMRLASPWEAMRTALMSTATVEGDMVH
jgi:hypothetical protein